VTSWMPLWGVLKSYFCWRKSSFTSWLCSILQTPLSALTIGKAITKVKPQRNFEIHGLVERTSMLRYKVILLAPCCLSYSIMIPSGARACILLQEANNFHQVWYGTSFRLALRARAIGPAPTNRSNREERPPAMRVVFSIIYGQVSRLHP